jgi:ABC-type glycerol-3-phosphate transport system permease component
MSSGDNAIASVYERTGAQPGRWWQAVRRETILPFVRAALLITILSVALLPIVYLLALSFKTPDQVLRIVSSDQTDFEKLDQYFSKYSLGSLHC